MSVPRFNPEIVEKHRENVVSLWSIRDNAVGGSSFRLADLVRFDERVEANIDGLRIAERSGWSIRLDDLENGEAGSFFSAGVLALESSDPRRLDEIIEIAYASAARTTSEQYHPAYDPWRGLVSALAWVEPFHAARTIERVLDSPRPRTRWLGAAAGGARRAVRQRGLEAALADQAPLVRARAARAMGELGRNDSRVKLNALLEDSDESCRFWAAWSAVLLGTMEGVRSLAEIAQGLGQWSDPALDLLLRRLTVARANEFLHPLGQDARLRRSVVRATAVIGDPLYVPWLIGRIGDLTVARCAGEAFATITGADLAALRREPPADFAAEPNDDPDDRTVIPDDDEELAWLDPEKCRRWWEVNGERFHIGTAYFHGEPKASVDWIGVLSEGRQALRRAAAIELALRRPGQAMFEVRGRGEIQRLLLQRAGQSS
jgi:uncharacterized protein (TIGR02270 family)